MGAGLCVLVSDSPESLEALGDSGFTFKRGDVTDLPRALTDLLSDPQYRISAGERARQRVNGITFYGKTSWMRLATI